MKAFWTREDKPLWIVKELNGGAQVLRIHARNLSQVIRIIKTKKDKGVFHYPSISIQKENTTQAIINYVTAL